MLEQGIREKDISVYRDIRVEGNLLSTMLSFAQLHGNTTGTWHLQDDILISRDFKQVTELMDRGVVCGFCSKYCNEYPKGVVSPDQMWYSFPCIRIPDKLARECADWFFVDVFNNPDYRPWINEKKYDDSLFRIFMQDYYPYTQVVNLAPNIVNHIDYMLGGSVVNHQRDEEITSVYWEDKEMLINLELKLRTALLKDPKIKICK